MEADYTGPGLGRTRVPNTAEAITALLHSPELHALGELLPPRWDLGRPREYPGWSVLLFGALARHYRSAARAHAELHSPAVWTHSLNQARSAASELGIAVPPCPAPPTWSTWVTARNTHLTTDAGLAAVAGVHLDQAADLAHDLGLCLPTGGGSWSHPAKSRTAYGDGTLVTPMYRPPAAVRTTLPDGSVQLRYPDPGTGELLTRPPHRFDPDAVEHHGKGGPAPATNYVAWHVRGAAYYERVILTIGRVDAPGREADTAVALLRDIRRVLGDDLQAVIYDGAFHGVHIDHVMRHYGYVVISKPGTMTAEDSAPQAVRLPGGRTAKSLPLGTWEHHTPTGRCVHLLAAVNGAVSEIGLDEAGDPLLLSQLARRQVKRPRRSRAVPLQRRLRDPLQRRPVLGLAQPPPRPGRGPRPAGKPAHHRRQRPGRATPGRAAQRRRRTPPPVQEHPARRTRDERGLATRTAGPLLLRLTQQRRGPAPRHRRRHHDHHRSTAGRAMTPRHTRAGRLITSSLTHPAHVLSRGTRASSSLCSDLKNRALRCLRQQRRAHHEQRPRSAAPDVAQCQRSSEPSPPGPWRWRWRCLSGRTDLALVAADCTVVLRAASHRGRLLVTTSARGLLADAWTIPELRRHVAEARAWPGPNTTANGSLSTPPRMPTPVRPRHRPGCAPSPRPG